MTAATETVGAACGGGDGAGRRLPVWVQAAAAAGVSGGLMAACYWPLGFHWLAWVAMVPWLMMLPRLGAGGAWLGGTLVGLIFYRIGFNWGFALNGLLGGGVIVVFSIWMGFSFRVVRLLMQRFGDDAILWAAPLAFVGQEVIRCEAFPRLRIPFLALGYSQSGNLWVAQIASIGGVYFLTGLLVASNAAIAYGLVRRSRRSWQAGVDAQSRVEAGWLPAGIFRWPLAAAWLSGGAAWLPAATVGLAVAVLGVMAQPPDYSNQPPIPVACVQAETFDMKRYVELTRQALADPSRPGIVVLPEHTITEWADEHNSTVRALAKLAREHQAYICVGVHTRAERGSQCPYDNVGMVIGPDGKIIARQSKCVPLPFFEDGNPAKSQAAVETALGTVGVYVCYDGLFTDVPRRVVDYGAELLLVPVMDPQPWPEQERRQHAGMAPMRCIELRRCAVRAASSGVSQIIDATGRVQASRTKEQGQGVVLGSVYLNDRQTLFARGGRVFAPAVAVAFIAAVVLLTVAQWVSGRRGRAGTSLGEDARLE